MVATVLTGGVPAAMGSVMCPWDAMWWQQSYTVVTGGYHVAILLRG